MAKDYPSLIIHLSPNRNLIFIAATIIPNSEACFSTINDSLSRFFPSSPFGTKRSNEVARSRKGPSTSVTRINSPGQRFTATHGIGAQAREKKLFLFVVDRPDVNYLAVSSNVAIEGTQGGPERYELYMKYGSPPSTRYYDQKSTLTASDSYVGDVLYR